MYAKNQILTLTISSDKVWKYMFFQDLNVEGRQSIWKSKKTWHYKAAIVSGQHNAEVLVVSNLTNV